MTTTQPAQAVRVRADVYPASLVVAPASSPEPASALRLPGPDDPHGRRRLDKVRVLVTDTHVYVFEDSSNGPQVIFSETFTDYTPPIPQHRRRVRDAMNPSEATLTTQSGKTLAFSRQSGCGCGSRLKTFDPFKIIVAAARKPAEQDPGGS